MAAISVTYPYLNVRTASGPEAAQNFLDIVNGLSDGTKDITVAAISCTSLTVGGASTSGTNTGDVTLAAIGAVANANGASLSGQILTLQPASASFGGVLTIGAQSIAGVKTFSSSPIINARGLTINNSAANSTFLFINSTDNSSAASHAVVELSVGGASGGDPYIRLDLPGTFWSLGGDNSDGDAFKISESAALDTTNDYIRIGSGGVIRLGLAASTIGFYGVTAVGRSSAYTVTNRTTDRTYDANATTLDEIADVLGTLILDLQSVGLLS